MWVTVTKYNHFRYENVVHMITGCPSKPTLYNLFDYARDFTTTPTLSFASIDNEDDEIQYRVYWDTDPSLGSADSATTGMYSSGETVSYTFSSPLVDGETYYWRARGRDPLGSGYGGAVARSGALRLAHRCLPTPAPGIKQRAASSMTMF
jgi:hypothetical protein